MGRKLAIVILILVLTPASTFAYVYLRPDQLLNPITRFLWKQRFEERGSRMNLIPDIFEVGANEDDVLMKVQDAGFTNWTTKADPQGRGVEYVYQRGAGGFFPCGYEFYLTLEFDENSNLQSAENKLGIVCV